MAALHTLLAVAPWYVLTPLIAVDLPGGVGTYGLLLTSFGIGGLLGALIAGRFKPRLPGIWSLAAISLFAVPCFLLTVTTETAVLLAGFAVAGAGTQFFDVYKITAIRARSRAPPRPRDELDFRLLRHDPFGQLITAA
jgi:predicted MFS family arabinose efflux permease